MPLRDKRVGFVIASFIKTMKKIDEIGSIRTPGSRRRQACTGRSGVSVTVAGGAKRGSRAKAATGRPVTASGFLAQYIGQASAPVGATPDRGLRHRAAGEAYTATDLLPARPSRRALVDRSY